VSAFDTPTILLIRKFDDLDMPKSLFDRGPRAAAIPQDPPIIHFGHAVGRSLDSRPDTEFVPVRAFPHHKPIHFPGLPSFAKSCLRAARSDCAPRNLRRPAWRVTGEGSVGSLPWVSERGCREFQQAPVQAASRSCRPAYIARDPLFPLFPTQNGPTGSRGALTARRW